MKFFKWQALYININQQVLMSLAFLGPGYAVWLGLLSSMKLFCHWSHGCKCGIIDRYTGALDLQPLPKPFYGKGEGKLLYPSGASHL